MPKPDTGIQYHVTVRSPICLKLGTDIVEVRSFDAILEGASDTVSGALVFRSDRIWIHRVGGSGKHVGFKNRLTVPESNIASLVPQPFTEK